MTAALPDWDVVTDAELVSAAAAGDRAAFASIYDRYADPLHDFCIGMLRNREAAADCVQDAFCIAAKSLSKLNDPTKLRPWLYSIARYQALRCIRSRTREQAVDEVPEALDGGPGPATLVRRNELADLIAAAAGGLSDRDQAVFELAYRRGLEGAELAEALGVSANNAKKMAQRLRETIERSLGALLVSRAARNNAHACPGLAEVLDGWDGNFSVLMRKRVARHIESCPACDDLRRQMVNPVALLGSTPLVIAAPAVLRQRTLGSIHLGSPAGPGPVPQHTGSDATLVQSAIGAEPSVVESAIGAEPSAVESAVGASPTVAPDGEGRRRLFTRRAVKGAALVAGLLAVPAVAIAVQHNAGVSVNPANVTQSPSAPPTSIGRSAPPTTTPTAVPIMAPPIEPTPAPTSVNDQAPVTTTQPPAATTTEPPGNSTTSPGPTVTRTTVQSSPTATPTRIQLPPLPGQTVQPSPPSGSTGSPSPTKVKPPLPIAPQQPITVNPGGGGSGGLY
jgi:RNA polymerase sigma factor (sigma-70 family)